MTNDLAAFFMAGVAISRGVGHAEYSQRERGLCVPHFVFSPPPIPSEIQFCRRKEFLLARKTSRRDFMRAAAWTGAGFWVAARSPLLFSQSPNEKLDVGVVGVGGRGAENLKSVGDQNVVALCDIDQEQLYEASKKFPKARLHNDWRRLLEEKLDAVVVSTPDHMHAFASVHAMKAGFHVYCEKPLAHSIHEAHVAAATAVERRRATQMGVQIHAESNYRRVVEIVKSGALGEVKECHAWVGKTWSGGERPAETPPVPPHVHYDLWLGPAPERPYHPTYLPANWRRWWDFGGGTLADMGCHYMDVIHWALDLTNPTAVEAEGPPVHAETTPAWLVVHYDHPARGKLPPVRVTWHDGGKRPKQFDEGKLPKWGDGVLFVGSKGMLLADYGHYKLLPEGDFAGFKPPAPFIPDSIGHHREWIEACKSGAPTTCNFSYGGSLTESVLLGNVAYRSGKRIEWSRAGLRVTNYPDANKLVRREYRKGWTL